MGVWWNLHLTHAKLWNLQWFCQISNWLDDPGENILIFIIRRHCLPFAGRPFPKSDSDLLFSFLLSAVMIQSHFALKNFVLPTSEYYICIQTDKKSHTNYSTTHHRYHGAKFQGVIKSPPQMLSAYCCPLPFASSLQSFPPCANPFPRSIFTSSSACLWLQFLVSFHLAFFQHVQPIIVFRTHRILRWSYDLYLEFLPSVAAKSDKNLMTVSNISVCFGPTLLRPEEETVASIMDIKFYNVVVEILVDNYDRIFHSQPEPPETEIRTNGGAQHQDMR